MAPGWLCVHLHSLRQAPVLHKCVLRTSQPAPLPVPTCPPGAGESHPALILDPFPGLGVFLAEVWR